MSATIHRLLMTISAIAGGLGGLIAINPPGSISTDAGGWLAFAAGAIALIANTIRVQWGKDALA